MAESRADELSTREEARGLPTSGAGRDPAADPDSTASDRGAGPGGATDRDPLLMLVMQWEEAVARGEDLDPRTLCGDDTRLAAALDERIQKRRRLQALLALPSGPGGDRAAPPLPEIPGHEVLGRIGRGGMGIVYRARDVRLGRVVALKTLAEARYATGEQVERFLDEARAVARLQHPNIVGIHAIGEHEGQPYLSLEYVDGDSLARRLADGPMAPRAAAELIETLARAIDAAHRAGVVHRDLKPANVLMTADGVPKVGDFGLAKLMDSESARTWSGQVLGTPSYMAPEQAEGHSGRAGPPADVYALGAILYQALTGRPPFLGDSALETLKLVAGTDPVPPTRLRPGVPRDLETICLKCLEKDPSRRYESAAAMADDVRRFLDGRPIAARPVGAVGRSLRWARRNRMLAAVSAALVAAFALGTPGFFALWLAARADRARADRERHNALTALGQAEEARRRAESALGRARNAIGYILHNEGTDLDLEEARPYRRKLTDAGLREAQELLRTAEGDPHSEWQWIAGHLTLARVQNQSGQSEAARETGRKALALAEAFHSRQGSPESRGLLAMILHRLAELPYGAGEAREYARRSNILYEAMAAERSEGPIPYAGNISKNYHNIGHLWFMQGQKKEAEAAFLSAIRICEESIRRGDRDREIRLDQARALLYLGRVRLQSQRGDDAVEPIRRSIATFQSIFEEDPSDFATARQLELAQEELAMTYRGLGRVDDGIACHEAARATLEAAAARHKGVVSRMAEIQQRIAVVDFNLADTCSGDLSRYHDRSRAALAEAYRICDKLELVEPLSGDLELVLAYALIDRIEARIEDGEPPDQEDFARAERVLEDLRPVRQWNLHARTLLVIVRHAWADELEARGRSAEARTHRERASVDARGDGDALFEAALIGADKARWIGTYPTRIDARRQRARREQRLRHVVAWIGQAIGEGFRDAARFHRETLLAILADDPGYRAVAASLDDRVFPDDPFATPPGGDATGGAAPH
jgi:serine/threonine-protein kinase